MIGTILMIADLIDKLIRPTALASSRQSCIGRHPIGITSRDRRSILIDHKHLAFFPGFRISPAAVLQCNSSCEIQRVQSFVLIDPRYLYLISNWPP